MIITAFSLRPEVKGFVFIGVSFQERLDLRRSWRHRTSAAGP
ncbi:hypothetical protein T261_08518 [Streptomyces lydicus]|nr:hypothetical protein T261_08518 [Streptomyces lydicus]